MSKNPAQNHLTWEQFRDSSIEAQVDFLAKRLNLNENRQEKARRILTICAENNGRFESGGWPPSGLSKGRPKSVI